MTPLVSVITVTYNCVSTLPATLQSVRGGKTDDVEYVVIDGASSDGTLELLRANEDIIDVLISEPDHGIYDAMNKGTEHARGEYVIFLNGDDQFISEAFVAALKLLPRPASHIETFTTLVGSSEVPDEVLTAAPWKLLLFNSIPHPSTFTPLRVQRSLRFDTSYRIAADYDFFLQAWVRHVKFRVHTLPMAVHHRGGASGDVENSSAEVRRAQRSALPWHLALAGRLLATVLTIKNLIGRSVTDHA